jgi:hypothetical protein
MSAYKRCFGAMLFLIVGALGAASTSVASATPAAHRGPFRFTGTHHVRGDSPNPFGISIATDTHIAYIADADESSMSVLWVDTGKVRTIREPAMGARIDGICVNPRNGRAFVPEDQAPTVDVFQGATRVRTLTLPESGSGAMQALYNPTNRLLYITDQFLDAVHVFRRSKEIAIIPLDGQLGHGGGPGFGAVDARNGHVYIPMANDGTLDVISGTTLTRKIQTKTNGIWVAIDAKRGIAYTADPSQNKVGVTDLHTKASRSVSVSQPRAISVDDNSGLAYVSTSAGTAYVLHGGKIVATVPETTRPSASEPFAVDAIRDLAIIPSNHRLQILHKASIVQTLTLPSKTDSAVAAFDSSTGNAVVTQEIAETISVLSTHTSPERSAQR